MIGKPIKPITARAISTGPRIRHLSAAQLVVYMQMPAKKYGGATRHCDAPMEKPIPSLKMTGRKYAIAYVQVVMQKKIIANPQILRSRPEEAQSLREKGTGFASLRSLLMRRTT